MEPNISLTDRQTYLGIEMTWSSRYTSRIRISKKNFQSSIFNFNFQVYLVLDKFTCITSQCRR